MLDQALQVTKKGQVVLGIGMATLISTNGNSCIEVGNVDDVRIAGVILEAGNKMSETLLKWGDMGYSASVTEPGVGSDIFARVGGPTSSR
jgi:hypothetical protein